LNGLELIRWHLWIIIVMRWNINLFFRRRFNYFFDLRSLFGCKIHIFINLSVTILISNAHIVLSFLNFFSLLFSQLLSSNNHETVLIRRNYLFIVFQVALFQNLSDWHVFRVHLNNILYLRFLSLSIFLNLFGLNFFLKVNLIETCDKFRFILNIWINAFCLICILNI